MAQVQAITLDLFGTLVDFSIERDEPPLVRELLHEAGETADADAVLATWVAASLDDRAKTPFRRVHEALVTGAEETAREHGLAIDPERWADRLEQLWALRPMFGDVRDALDRIEAAGVPWAIVTNLDRHVLDRVLASTHLGSRSPVAVSSEHARAYKPHPRPFRMALDRLGVDPASAVHVGDRPSEDRAGAHAAGMWCVIVDRRQEAALVQAVKALLDVT